ncbi:MAG: hypothetical protein HYZ34_04510 [Ignavibacteriae bacterium]|nr:hypothetical protein [Ignavibacteriota bacterium]
MDALHLLAHIAKKFNELNIRYMVTGSVMSSYYGVPRATHDVDVVISIIVADAEKIRNAFEDEFYISDIEHAIMHKQMFNMIHQESQMKVDCWILNERNDFRLHAFQSRTQTTILDVKIPIITKEDLVISKLLWYKDSESEIQLRDIRGMLLSSGSSFNNNYIEGWCDKLRITELWKQVLIMKETNQTR